MSSPLVPKVITSKRKTLALQFLHDGTLVVKAPLRTPQFMINAFVHQHRDWIEKHTEKVQQRQRLKKHEYKEGEIFLYVGQEVVLTIGSYKEISVSSGKLLFPSHLVFRIQKELHTWYIHKAKELITSQVERYAKEMKTTYKLIAFSDTKSQWGRCTSDNRLQFSWRLIMAPPLTLNYVVIHELAHTMEKNHSRSFWSKVRLFNPSFRQQIQWLKDNGSSLFI